MIRSEPPFGIKAFARLFLPVEWVTKVRTAALFNFVF